MTPKVNQLIWTKEHFFGCEGWVGKGHEHIYRISTWGVFWIVQGLEGDFSSVDDAQAAAQADYDARIIAALDPAWLAALEAQVKSADGLAETTDTQARLLKDGVGAVKGRINIVADRLLSASATYRAAKEANHE